MAQVKFVNAAKYAGIRYPAHTPFEVDDSDVESLVQQGAIVTVPSEKKVKSIDEMKVDELKEYAKEHEIDISKAQNKADIVAAIKAAENSDE